MKIKLESEISCLITLTECNKWFSYLQCSTRLVTVGVKLAIKGAPYTDS